MRNKEQDERLAREGYIPVKEAAERAGTSATTIYRALARGDIKGTKAGHSQYVEVQSLRLYAGMAYQEPADADPS